MQDLTYHHPLLAQHTEREWLLTNGLGGFASGTAGGIPARRYHAWLIAAMAPPVARIVALHSCLETAVLAAGNLANGQPLTPSTPPSPDNLRLDFTSYRFTEWSGPGQDRPGMGLRGIISPSGISNLSSFTRRTGADHSCAWEYRSPDHNLTFRRTLTLARGQNSCTLHYAIEADARFKHLELRPFAPLRDFHALGTRGEHTPIAHAAEDGIVNITSGLFRLDLSITASDPRAHIAFVSDPQWWDRLYYYKESLRGQDAKEDLPSPGYYVITPPPDWRGGRLELSLTASANHASTNHTTPSQPPPLPRPQTTQLTVQAGHEHERAALEAAAEQFVVRRDFKAVPRTTIIAGYPWFSDWGRDTCIALPGLLITTGRLAAARSCLDSFAALMEGGLIPNCFDNGSGRAEYNSADAPLWFVHAACQLALAMGQPLDPSGELKEIAGACLDIVASYERGTAFDIKMDPSDGLICAGNIGTQLTWMDAKRDGVVFTPRHGKPVELSALWYNALRGLSALLPANLQQKRRELNDIAAWSDRSFERVFWNADRNCLFDCLTPVHSADGTVVGWNQSQLLRPNQIFAVSLPYSPLDRRLHSPVVTAVRAHLLTPFGLRTLAPTDPGYEPRFEGPLFSRDRAYHNGTVWPWLIGPYCEAVLRLGGFSADAKQEAGAALAPLLSLLTESSTLDQADSSTHLLGPIATVSEVYDAQPPYRPDGCPAQAWSIAELLRVHHMIYTREGTATAATPQPAA